MGFDTIEINLVTLINNLYSTPHCLLLQAPPPSDDYMVDHPHNAPPCHPPGLHHPHHIRPAMLHQL